MKISQEILNLVPSGNFIVGYAGSLGFVNCIDEIMDAAIILKNSPVSFLFLGDGPLRDKFKARSIESGLSNVHFFDPVPKYQVPKFLQKCDLLVNPWKANLEVYKYGVSPNKWVDYMMSAKPILVPFDGYPSVISDADCGKFIDPQNPKLLADEILAFSTMDKKILNQMGENGRKYLFAHLSFDVLAKKYLSIIDGLPV